jgi:PIN domain nuclease of toxin-antitoxin system
MKCLLDTCTLIWVLSDKNKLSQVAFDVISSDKNTLHVSAVSFFEMSIKSSIGKLSFNDFHLNELPAILYNSGVELLSMDPFESIDLHDLPLKENHRDPFDRMLICQAIARNLTLISSDKSMTGYCEDGLSLLW